MLPCRFWKRLILCLALIAMPACMHAAEDAPKEALPAPTGDPELAIRMVALAQDTLRQKIVLPPHFRQSAALLIAASKLDPKEPRYPRMLYENMLQLRDIDGALDALRAYRALAPNDQWAAVQYIDLQVRNMQTADARMEYLLKVIDAPAGVAAEVRSHAAFRAAQLCKERGQSDLAKSYLDQALKLNPVNIEALRAKFEALPADATAVDRVTLMHAMLKCNPLQPGNTYRIARELSEAGLVDESLRYFTLSINLAGASNTAMGREFAMAYGSELFMMNQPQLLGVTKSIVEQLLKQDVGDVEALLLRWFAEKGMNDKENLPKTQQAVLNAAYNRLLVLRGKLASAASPATRPIDTPEAILVPDLSPDIKALEDEKFAELREPYAQALADLAWYMVFVNNSKPAETAPLIANLKTLLTDKDPTVARIEGWTLMAAGKNDEAMVKFKAVADQDTLARMAILLIQGKDPAQKDKAANEARQLLGQNPSGLLSVILLDGMRELNIKMPQRDDAPALKQLIESFPKEWFSIIESPQQFYTLKCEMNDGRVLFPFGEPMMAVVSIRNNSPFPITIGPEGVIKPDLWFDANFRGFVAQQVLGAAYERLTAKIVLKPNETVWQTVRLDQGQLSQTLSSLPQPSLMFYGQVRTNPRSEGGSSPGGYGLPFSSITERGRFALDQQNMRMLSNLIANGTPTEKIRSLELVGALIESVKANAQGNAQVPAMIASFVEALDKSTNDSVAGVSTWASFMTAVQSGEKRPAILNNLLGHEDPARRVLGLLIANSLPVDEQQKRLRAILEKEKEPMVRLYGTAMLEIVDLAAQLKAAQQKPPETPKP